MKSPLSLALTAMVLTAAADEPAIGPQSVRTIFERHDQTGVPGKEIVIGSAMLPPGTTIGYHSHPGDESGYVLKGVLVLHTRGQPDKILKAGDSFFNVRGAVQSLSTVPGEEGGACAKRPQFWKRQVIPQACNSPMQRRLHHTNRVRPN